MRRPSSPTSLLTAAVAPLPVKRTTSSGPAWTAAAMAARASSRRRVMTRPVVEMAVWVLAYSGRTPASAASTKARERPVAVWSA